MEEFQRVLDPKKRLEWRTHAPLYLKKGNCFLWFIPWDLSEEQFSLDLGYLQGCLSFLPDKTIMVFKPDASAGGFPRNFCFCACFEPEQ